VSEIPRADAICRLTVEENRLLTIPDTLGDPRVATSKVVTQAPRFRAYAGYRLPTSTVPSWGPSACSTCNHASSPPPIARRSPDLAALAQRELLTDQLSSAQAALTSKLSLARREALMDPLTHLWNRRGASVLLKAAFRKADERRSPLTLALLDLDNFKRVNDNLRPSEWRRSAAQDREPVADRRARRR